MEITEREIQATAKRIMGEIAFGQLWASATGAENVARELLQLKRLVDMRGKTIAQLQAELDWYRQLHPLDKYEGTITEG